VRGAWYQRAMERRRYGEHHRAFSPARLGEFDGAFDRRLVTRDDDLAAAIVVACLAHLSLRGFGGDGRSRVELETEKRRHRTDADRDRLLHAAPATAPEPRRLRTVD